MHAIVHDSSDAGPASEATWPGRTSTPAPRDVQGDPLGEADVANQPSTLSGAHAVEHRPAATPAVTGRLDAVSKELASSVAGTSARRVVLVASPGVPLFELSIAAE